MPRFRLPSVIALITGICLFLALNTVPWHRETMLYIDGKGAYHLEVDSYGWPFTFIQYHSGAQLTSEVAADLDPHNPNGSFAAFNKKKRLHVFDNLGIACILSLTFAVTIELVLRRSRQRGVNIIRE